MRASEPTHNEVQQRKSDQDDEQDRDRAVREHGAAVREDHDERWQADAHDFHQPEE